MAQRVSAVCYLLQLSDLQGLPITGVPERHLVKQGARAKRAEGKEFGARQGEESAFEGMRGACGTAAVRVQLLVLRMRRLGAPFPCLSWTILEVAEATFRRKGAEVSRPCMRACSMCRWRAAGHGDSTADGCLTPTAKTLRLTAEHGQE
jgi:hypothetical protein